MMMNKNVLIILGVVVILVIVGAASWFYLAPSTPGPVISLPKVKELNDEISAIDLTSDLEAVAKDDSDLTVLDSALEDMIEGVAFDAQTLNSELKSIDLTPDLNSLTKDETSLSTLDESFQEF